MVTALVITGIILVLGTVIFFEAGDVVMEKLRPTRAAVTEMPLPFLILPLYGRDGGSIIPSPIGHRAMELVDPPPPVAPVPSVAPTSEEAHATATAVTSARVPESRHVLPQHAAADDVAIPADKTVIFQRPLDEAVQILPGRLEVLAGEQRREDIRFVGTIAGEAELVVGREGGPPQRVVTLHSPTVSRRHARLRFIDGRWAITNLSSTNPAVVNDETLPSHDTGTRVLADGDRIELGEVVLRFHTR